MNPQTAEQLPTIARFFSSAVVRELASNGKSALLGRLLRQSNSLGHIAADARLFDLFEAAFDILRRGRERHEYVFKAAITKRILLGRHSLRTAAMLTEFRVADTKADVVILNGTAAAFEIKSERDTLQRLQKQIEAYRTVFAVVNVVAADRHMDEIRTLYRKTSVCMLCLADYA